MEAVTQAAAGLIAAVITALGYKVWVWLTEKMKASQQARLGVAAERAAGQVVQAMDNANAATAILAAGSAVLQSTEVAAATDRLMTTMGDTINTLGGSREQIENLVRGELGKLLVKAVTK